MNWLNTHIEKANAEIWRVLYWIVLPLLVVTGGRIWIASSLKKEAVYQFALILLGEAQFVIATSLLFVLCLRIFSSWPRLSSFLRGVGALFFFAFSFVSLFDIGYFQATGDRLDLESILVFCTEFQMIWPVVQSELTTIHIVGFASLLIPFFLSVLVPTPKRLFPRLVLYSYVVLLPVLQVVYEMTPLPQSELRGLERALLFQFGEELVLSIQERPILPEESELTPLEIKGNSESPPNIIVFFLESTGLKHTSLGGEFDSTPNLKRFAEHGLVVSDANAVVPHTTKALISTLCGDWPQLVTGVPEASFGGLPRDCLPTLLKSIGYRTAFVQTARHTFEQRRELVHFMGFDFFRSKESLDRRKFESSNYFGLDDQAMIEPAMQWLKNGEQPFFLGMLSLASHHKYTLPKKIKPKFPKKGTKFEHLSTVHYVDSVLGKFVDRLEKEGLMDNTLIVILGDHGEGMGEHGRKQHDLVLWQEGLSIPMVLYGPSVLEKTGVITGPRQQIDILPTILELVGAEIVSGATRGISLFQSVSEERELFFSCWRERKCMAKRMGSQKFIDHYGRRTWEWFSLQDDTTEKNNLHKNKPKELLQGLQLELRDWKRKVKGLYKARFDSWKKDAFTPATQEPAIMSWPGISLLGCRLADEKVYKNTSPWLLCRWRVEEAIEELREIHLEFRYGKIVRSQEWNPTNGVLPMYRWPLGTEFEEHIPLQLPYSKKGMVHLFIGLRNSAEELLSPLGEQEENMIEVASFRIE